MAIYGISEVQDTVTALPGAYLGLSIVLSLLDITLCALQLADVVKHLCFCVCQRLTQLSNPSACFAGRLPVQGEAPLRMELGFWETARHVVLPQENGWYIA